ncbi:MAG TPA: hypothetical protein VK488_15035 [Gaiellaceae bacterium]|nr:hypothetical protein [Gaiellaceae bacterium]
MGLFRRGEPIHEKLAREGGLDLPRGVNEVALPPAIDPRHPLWQVAGIHGIPRVREWDAVTSAEAPALPGDETDFVTLADGTIFTDDDLPDEALTPLADALEGLVEAPYHALALRQAADVWSVAAMRVTVVEVPEDIAGDKVELVVNEGERTTRLDDVETRADLPTLEQFASQQFGSFVLRATRLDDRLWEVTVLPL